MQKEEETEDHGTYLSGEWVKEEKVVKMGDFQKGTVKEKQSQTLAKC